MRWSYRTFSYFSLGLLAAALAAWPARAQAVDPNVEMHDHFEKGQAAYEQRKYDLAAQEFRAAYDAVPKASLLFNEAVCYEKKRDYSKAAQLFKDYLNKSPQAKDRKEISGRIAALEAEVQRQSNPNVKPTGPTLASLGEAKVRGFINIESKPPGATIYLDDRKSEPLGTTPWNGSLDGKHKLIIVAQGYKDEERDINPDPARITDIYLALSQQHYLGWLEVRSNVAAADVYMDGKEAGSVGRTPYLANVTPGKHTLIVTKEGFTEVAKDVNIVAGEVHKFDVTLEKAPIGFIHVGGTSIEGAIVKLDGKVVCPAAPCRFQSPDGDHQIDVEKPGLKTYSRKMTVIKATETELSVKLMPTEGKTDVIWKYAFAAAFITGGIVLGLQANSAYNDLQSDINKGMPPIAPDDDRFTKGKIFSYAADGCFLIGAVTAVVGTISLFSEHGPPSIGSAESRELGTMGTSSLLIPTIRPQVAPGYAGLSAEVRW
jgi:PEGA domain-containing protein/tetratricopeptide repeat protein